MTRFADAKFSVAALPTAEYAEGHARTFAPQGEDKKCTECEGAGSHPPILPWPGNRRIECTACNGTGLRAWQRSA